MAASSQLEGWKGTDVSVRDIERELCRLRAAGGREGAPELRTSVMTHLAWVPEEWIPAATDVIAGLAERHPSRLILLTPEPDAADGLDAEVSLTCFRLPGLQGHVCCETIALRLRGRRVVAPASIVLPLLISDLPVFLRWRGQPPFEAPAFEQLTDVADRLVVDSREWDELPAAYSELGACFERAAVSDIAWARTHPWRLALAALWPEIAGARELRIAGPPAEALLLAGWLRARLRREVELVREESEEVEAVAVDGEPLARPRVDPVTPSDLLSAELDRFVRDPIYEESVRALALKR